MRVSARPIALRAVLVAILLAPALLAAIPQPDAVARSTREPANVLLISFDTLRADRLNCYGYRRRVTTPNMDALARDGILVETTIAASPWTTPSHLSLLTSLLPHRHGVVASFADLHRGFAGEGTVPRLADERLTLAEALLSHGYRTAAFTGGATMDPRLGFDQGFERYETSMTKLSGKRMQPLFAWLEAPRAQPFLLFWHNFEVHAPYLAADFLGDVLPRARAKRLALALAAFERSSSGGDVTENALQGEVVLQKQGEYTREVCDALYDGGVLSADRWLGKVVAFLRARGLYDRTLIVLTSDHGEQLGERGGAFYNMHGRSLFDEMVHVPLILKLPGQAHAGVHLGGVTSSIDVMPTILDLVGATPAKNEMQGHSLRLGWEASGTPRPPRALFALSEALSRGPEQKSIRTAQHKLILTVRRPETRQNGRGYLPPGAAKRELYDLAHDPHELSDALAVSSPDTATRERARALERALRLLHAGRASRASETQLDDGAVERLRALGYVN
jgi:arylsulfatase A-like enzyme